MLADESGEFGSIWQCPSETGEICHVEITERDSQELWVNYERLAESHGPSFAMQKLRDQSEIYPVFKQLFQRKIQ